MRFGNFLLIIFLAFCLKPAGASEAIKSDIDGIVGLHFESQGQFFTKVEVTYKNDKGGWDHTAPNPGYLPLPVLKSKGEEKKPESIQVALFHRTPFAEEGQKGLYETLKKFYPGVAIKLNVFKAPALVSADAQAASEASKKDEGPDQKESLIREIGPIVFGGIVLLVATFLIGHSLKSAFKSLSEEFGQGAKSIAGSLKKNNAAEKDPLKNAGMDKSMLEREFTTSFRLAKDVLKHYPSQLSKLIKNESDVIFLKYLVPMLDFSAEEIETLSIPKNVKEQMLSVNESKVFDRMEFFQWLQKFNQNALAGLTQSSGPILLALDHETRNQLKKLGQEKLSMVLQKAQDPLAAALILELCDTATRQNYLAQDASMPAKVLEISTSGDISPQRIAELASEIIQLTNSGMQEGQLDIDHLIGESVEWIIDYTKKLSFQEEEQYINDICGNSPSLRSRICECLWTLGDFTKGMGSDLKKFLESLSNDEKMAMCLVTNDQIRELVYQSMPTPKSRAIFMDKVKKQLSKPDTVILAQATALAREIINKARVMKPNTRLQIAA